ncbi:MAG: aminotransferase DegT [Candidatus Marinimicrobia bacterium]|nr:aminotransferase DegT [Candidatus Neomarinimicrobiota bacterium]
MKFIDLHSQYKKIKSNIDRDILSILDKGDFILGEKVYTLEKKLAKYANVKECITCASGTDALLIPLIANNISFGDAVFTTNFSFFATSEVISHIGATPVFVDVDKQTFNISPDLLEIEIKRVIKEGKLKPKAIIAVDLFGQLANYKKIKKIADKFDLFLIEDAAQSFGASFKGMKSCSFGDVAATSFYPAKPLGCYGDGGAIFTNNEELADIYRSIRVHGQGKDKYDNVRIGLNSRLDTIQAAVLLNKLEIFDNEIESRNNIADYYSEKLNDYVVIPFIDENNISSWAQYSILVNNEKERNGLIQYLNSKNIPTAIFYKKPFNKLDVYSNLNNNSFYISDKLSKIILSIPMHPYMKRNEQNLIIDSIIEYLR